MAGAVDTRGDVANVHGDPGGMGGDYGGCDMVTVAMLKDQTGSKGPRPFLYCVKCGGEYSANSGDYFMARPDTVMKCCKRNLKLVYKRVVYEQAISTSQTC